MVATAARSTNQKSQKIPLGITCCPRQSTAIQLHTNNYSGPPRRLLAHHWLFRLVIPLISRPPATGAAQRAPYEPRLPALKFLHPRKRRTRAPVLSGGPGAAPGGVALKNGQGHMRAQREVLSYSSLCVCVCRHYSTKMAVGLSAGLRNYFDTCGVFLFFNGSASTPLPLRRPLASSLSFPCPCGSACAATCWPGW